MEAIAIAPESLGVDPWLYQPMAAKTIYGYAHKALDLMYEHSTPPDPISYSVWFAYVAKTSPALVRRISQQLQRVGKISRHEIVEMYQTYIEDGYVEATRQNLGLELESSLKSVSEVVDKSMIRNESFGESLEQTAAEIGKVESTDDLQAIVSHIAAENSEMSRVTRELGQELTESKMHIANLNQKLDELQSLSLRDPLTSVSNRRAFDTRLRNEIANAETSKSGLCLALVDLDHFKRVNDSLGHQVGDQVLKHFAKVLEDLTPDGAMVARYGGEEFAIILSGTKIVKAHNTMIHIGHQFPKERFLTDEQHQQLGRITTSIGLTAYKPGRSSTELIATADKQLYAAKRAGRNCVKSEGFT